MRRVWLALVVLWAVHVSAQEVLMPVVGRHQASGSKQSGEVTIPFFDDFAGGRLDGRLWCGSQSDVTDGWGMYPPTVGVAKLDAVDEEGVLYQNISSTFSADTLESRTIRLDSVFEPFQEALGPSDSLYLTFYYTVGGRLSSFGGRIGDEPDEQDSLVLEFYSKESGEWVKVWGRGGCSAEELKTATGRYWQRVAVAVAEERYFNDGFRFRFRNICSLDPTTTAGLTGNSDQWYVDCVYLDKDRAHNDETERDVAFVEPARSLLKNYCAMPARQYRRTEMVENTEALITNRYSVTVASHYGYYVLDARGDTLYSYDGGYENAPPFENEGDYQRSGYHARAAVDFCYPENTLMTRYKVVHVVKEGVMGDQFKANDTVVFEQVFEDYYAFDDGSAESGYGLTSTSSNVFLAAEYNLPNADTLLKVKMCFNRARDGENGNVRFRIVVWKAGTNGPGEVVYRDEMLRQPQFGGLNEFKDYELERPVALEGLVYIGLEQDGADYLNLGFDRNYNHSDRLYYRIGSEWQRASAAGSIMFRPCFVPYETLGIVSVVREERELTVFPNPARDRFRLNGVERGDEVTVFDARGVEMQNVRAEGEMTEVECGVWAQGVYYVVVTAADGRRQGAKKVIIVK